MDRVELNMHIARIKLAGAVVTGGKVTLFRGANVPEETIRKLRYGDYLSAAKDGSDANGNDGASSYGANCVEFQLAVEDVIVNGAGEFQYKGDSDSIRGGVRYPVEIYRAYNDVYGSNYTSAEIDKQDNVRQVASQGLTGGRDEFDFLFEQHLKQFFASHSKQVNEPERPRG